jgi:hypothetical protein
MSPQDIRNIIVNDPALQALVPDSSAIAAALSADRTRARPFEIGNGLILATIGLAAGNALLDALHAAPEFRHVKPLLDRGGLDVSSPLVAQALAMLVASEVIEQEHADALIALGREPDPVSELDVRRAIYNDDGSLAV